MATLYILVLIISSNGTDYSEWSVLDSQMTASDCTLALMQLPQPAHYADVTISYSCELEIGD